MLHAYLGLERRVSALLEAERFCAAYGPVPVVRGISLALDSAEIVALMGRNGMGKTTLLRGLMGLTPVREGKLAFADREIAALPPEAIARAGIGYVPAGREIFGKPVGARKSRHVRAAGRRCRRLGSCAGARVVSAPWRAHRQRRQATVRRRTADAGDRPRA